MGINLNRALDYPFRIFFLSTALWGILVVPLWVAVVTGAISLPVPIPITRWHQHEMIYGFLSPAIAGFLLTAVCVWTGTERLHGVRLLLLWLVWLLGRILLLFEFGVPYFLIMAINLLFLPLVLLDAGIRVWKVRQQRQYGLILLLFLYWLIQFGFLLSNERYWVEASVISAFMLIAVVGGRITPAFSAAWLKKQGLNSDGVHTNDLLDKSAIGSGLVLCVAFFFENALLIGITALIAAAIQLLRTLAWRGWRVHTEPLLWILHLALLWIPAALVLLAAGKFGLLAESAWFHAAGVGAIASLILGVMARVSLGHTGRPLRLPSGITIAFMIIQVSALIRLFTSSNVLEWRVGISAAATAWVLAFGLFMWRYTGILLSPRADGQPG